MAKTGNKLIQERDVNPNSPTYNEVRWRNVGQAAECGNTVYQSVYYSDFVTKNDCSAGSGTSVEVEVLAGAFTSNISQADADQQAMNWFNQNKQAIANEQGTCEDPSIFTGTYISYGYLIKEGACNATEADVVNKLYTPSGFVTENQPAYWNASGTQSLGNGYYKMNNGRILVIQNGLIFSNNDNCGNELPQG